jgi:hypothetical protein
MEGVSRVGVSLPEVGVVERYGSFSGDFSGDRPSNKNSLFVCGVDGRPALFSGDLGELNEPPSKRLLKSLTLPVCSDCIRL